MVSFVVDQKLLFVFQERASSILGLNTILLGKNHNAEMGLKGKN